MMRVKLLGACALALLALAALGASGASAATGVVVTETGTPMPKGAHAIVDIYLGEVVCLQGSDGKLVNNGESRDQLTFKGFFTRRCQSGASISGAINESAISSAGRLTFRGNLEYMDETLYGPCLYQFTAFEGKVMFPAGLRLAGNATGKLAKGRRPCASTITVPYEVIDATETGSSLLVAETAI